MVKYSDFDNTLVSVLLKHTIDAETLVQYRGWGNMYPQWYKSEKSCQREMHGMSYLVLLH